VQAGLLLEPSPLSWKLTPAIAVSVSSAACYSASSLLPCPWKPGVSAYPGQAGWDWWSGTTCWKHISDLALSSIVGGPVMLLWYRQVNQDWEKVLNLHRILWYRDMRFGDNSGCPCREVAL